MSPYFYTNIKSKFTIACFTMVIVFAIYLLTSCSEDSNSSDSQSLLDVSKVSVELAYSTTPRLDSIVLDCMGADTLHIVHNSKDSSFELDLFPHNHWTLSAKLYANGGLMQEGEIVTKIEAGTALNLTIPMHALVGFLYVEIPLGFGNPAGISSGTLEISNEDTSYTYKTTFDDLNAIFTSDMLPLHKTYNIKLSLKNKANETIYNLEDSFILDEQSPVPDLTIKSLRAKVQLGIVTSDGVNKEFKLVIPGYSRYPTTGDIVVTEVFTAVNSKDSLQYEFIELYNGSLDTLSLEGCTIGTSSVASSSCGITAKYILPGEVLVLADSSKHTPTNYLNTEKWKALNNSKGSIVLQCMGSIMDSLYYAYKPDSLHIDVIPAMGTSKYGQSSQLSIKKWQKRDKGESWCLSEPTPGKLNYCE